MTIQFWIRENGKGAYCAGTLPDGAYDKNTCILVQKSPSQAHRWDNVKKEWYINAEHKKAWIRGPRDQELSRTDKFALFDYYDEFTVEQKAEIVSYRQELRDVTKKTSAEEIVMPECPGFMK